ncbi:MAG: 1-acyl-sn-glycerol-3-phosphate acyltransferase [Acholeplasmatales bacterium]|nr:1-acyl-sn-glycerol-3-phosphate acyltransferase [Acholeplasmatales bacterium]
MWIKKRHRFYRNLVTSVLKPIIKNKYNFKYKKPIKLEENSIVISNHTTSMDQFLIASMFKQHLYFMASHDIYQHRFVGKLINHLVAPIPKEKSKSTDLTAIKNCMRVVKEGGSICIFVEGNRTYDGHLCNVDDSIVKLVKMLKKPLVICNILGGFGSEPRWANKSRKGKLETTIKHIYKYDEIKDMSNEDLYKLIVDGITVDDENYFNNYKSNKRAEYIERLIYVCPVCGKLHTIYSKGNYVYCSECGLKAEYCSDLRFRSENKDFTITTVKEWSNFQLDFVKNIEYPDNEIIYQEEIEVYEPRMFKSKLKLGEGLVRLYNDCFVFDLDTEKIVLDFDNIEAVTCLGKKKLNIYHNGKTYQIFKEVNKNLIKYMHAYYIIKNKKAGANDDFIGI